MFNILKDQPQTEQDFSEFHLLRLEQSLSSVVHYQHLLKQPHIDKQTLNQIRYGLLNIPESQNTTLRLEHQGNDLTSVKLRCEGVISTIWETVKRFFTWLYERFKAVFDGSATNSTEIKRQPPRDSSHLTEEQKKPKKFAASHLSTYFTYNSDTDGTDQLKRVIDNCKNLKSCADKIMKFSFEAYLKPQDGTPSLKQELSEKFTKPLMALNISNAGIVSIDDAVRERIMKDQLHVFEIAPKFLLGIQSKENGMIGLEMVKAYDTNRCQDIEISYDFSVGFAAQLNRTLTFINNLVVDQSRLIDEKMKGVKNILGSASGENSVFVENCNLVLSIYKEWLVVFTNLAKFYDALKTAADHIEGKKK